MLPMKCDPSHNGSISGVASSDPPVVDGYTCTVTVLAASQSSSDAVAPAARGAKITSRKSGRVVSSVRTAAATWPSYGMGAPHASRRCSRAVAAGELPRPPLRVAVAARSTHSTWLASRLTGDTANCTRDSTAAAVEWLRAPLVAFVTHAGAVPSEELMRTGCPAQSPSESTPSAPTTRAAADAESMRHAPARHTGSRAANSPNQPAAGMAAAASCVESASAASMVTLRLPEGVTDSSIVCGVPSSMGTATDTCTSVQLGGSPYSNCCSARVHCSVDSRVHPAPVADGSSSTTSPLSRVNESSTPSGSDVEPLAAAVVGAA